MFQRGGPGYSSEETRFAKIAEIIRANGGKIVDLDEAKLTHVVINKRDSTRRLELIKVTSQ